MRATIRKIKAVKHGVAVRRGCAFCSPSPEDLSPVPCVCTCVYVCIQASVNVCIYAGIDARIYACVYACVYTQGRRVLQECARGQLRRNALPASAALCVVSRMRRINDRGRCIPAAAVGAGSMVALVSCMRRIKARSLCFPAVAI